MLIGMGKFYIYAHRNPINNEVFYVGKGSKGRAFDRRDRSNRWLEYVRDFIKCDLTFAVDILHICDDEQTAYALEEKEINNYKTLVNEQNYRPLSLNTLSFDLTLKRVGEAIKTERIYRNISLVALAESLNISRTTLQKIESGNDGSYQFNTLLRVLDGLNLRIRIP